MPHPSGCGGVSPSQSFTAGKGRAIIGAGDPLAEIRPFHGLRYQVSYVRDLATVVSPPYDVISPQEQRALYTRSPYNIVRLEYGQERPTDSDTDNRYTRAAEDLRRWVAE